MNRKTLNRNLHTRIGNRLRFRGEASYTPEEWTNFVRPLADDGGSPKEISAKAVEAILKARNEEAPKEPAVVKAEVTQAKAPKEPSKCRFPKVGEWGSGGRCANPAPEGSRCHAHEGWTLSDVSAKRKAAKAEKARRDAMA